MHNIPRRQVQKEFVGVQSNPLWLKISCSWEILDKFDKFGILTIHIHTYYLTFLFNKPFFFLSMNVCKIVGWVENNVDPGQIPHSAKTWLYVKYANLITSRKHPYIILTPLNPTFI